MLSWIFEHCKELAERELGLRGRPSLAVRAGEVTVVLSAAEALVDWTQYYFEGFFEMERGLVEPGDVIVGHDEALLSLLHSMPEDAWIKKPFWWELKVRSDLFIVVRQGKERSKDQSAYYFLWNDNSRLLVLTDRSDLTSRMVAMRSVRSLLLDRLSAYGWVYFHASCAARGNRCIAVVGEKFAGKTSTLLNLLIAGFDLMANDKIALRRENSGDRIVARGFPIAVGVRLGTLAAFEKGLSQLLKAASSIPPHSVNVEDINRALKVSRRDLNLQQADIKIRFIPRELVRACGAGIAAERTLSAVLVPVFAPGTRCAVIERLDEASARRLLGAQRLRGIAEISPEHGFFAGLGGSSGACDVSLVEAEILASTPVYSVTQDAISTIDTVRFVESLLT